MKFSEMKAKMSGLPEGYDGRKAKWNEIKGAFVIRKCCLIRSVQVNGEGDVVCNPVTEKPYFDYQLAFYIETEDGSKYNVRTNSRKLTSVFLGQLGDDAKADMVNQYGSEIFYLEPPEGKVKFCAIQQEYGKNKEKHDVAYLEEAD